MSATRRSKALRAFQDRNNLLVDGIAGKSTSGKAEQLQRCQGSRRNRYSAQDRDPQAENHRDPKPLH
ncbi:MAG: peptidoglycan-binding protein [Christensenellales bacterium]